jgi:hypothetical protein
MFKNGSEAPFDAQEFDVDLSGGSIDGSYTATQKFSNKDANGQDAPIYPNPSEVAGILVVHTGENVARSLRLG